MSTRIGRSCFSRGKQLIRSFRRRHSFDPSSFLLCQPASLILVDFRGKRNGGYQMYGNKEEAGLNSGGVDAPLKGRRWMLPLPSFAALHRRAGHFSLRSPLSRGYSFVPSFRQSNRTQQSISIDYM